MGLSENPTPCKTFRLTSEASCLRGQRRADRGQDGDQRLDDQPPNVLLVAHDLFILERAMRSPRAAVGFIPFK